MALETRTIQVLCEQVSRITLGINPMNLDNSGFTELTEEIVSHIDVLLAWYSSVFFVVRPSHDSPNKRDNAVVSLAATTTTINRLV